MRDHPSHSIRASLLETCARYERRELTDVALRESLGRKAAALRAVEPDAGKVLASFVTVLERIEQTRPAEVRWAEICAVLERVVAFAGLREPAPGSLESA